MNKEKKNQIQDQLKQKNIVIDLDTIITMCIETSMRCVNIGMIVQKNNLDDTDESALVETNIHAVLKYILRKYITGYDKMTKKIWED